MPSYLIKEVSATDISYLPNIVVSSVAMMFNDSSETYDEKMKAISASLSTLFVKSKDSEEKIKKILKEMGYEI